MWSWVEQLKEPVITKEDVDMLAGSHTEAAEALFLLEKVRGCWPVDKLTKAHKVLRAQNSRGKGNSCRIPYLGLI